MNNFKYTNDIRMHVCTRSWKMETVLCNNLKLLIKLLLIEEKLICQLHIGQAISQYRPFQWTVHVCILHYTKMFHQYNEAQ